MLSIKNPPPCPPCSCENSHLKSSSNYRDDRASDDRQQLELDLLNCSLDHSIKFSIRDYVFSTRSKDIKTNWPFSQKSLQLCLKHGVKELLPPFHSFDSVRNPTIEKYAVERISIDRENLSSYNGEFTSSSDHLVSVSSCNVGCDRKLAADCNDLNSRGSKGDKELPSNKSPRSELEADNLAAPLVAKTESASPSSKKIGGTNQNQFTKCQLIVKLGNIGDSRSNEDPATNSFVTSETMASKVCPVCKIFSSSSNTTLNAHIDQCLSGMSAVKETADSKVPKHRIKPRKTRLMVDIYETAPYCTLEELDRRNGTNWALNLGVATQNVEICEEEKNKTLSPVNLEDTNKEGAVYIDSNGTKLRILSKFNDLPTFSNKNDDSGSRKLFKRDRGRKILLHKKKKYHVPKLHKLLKHSPHGQTSYFIRPEHCSHERKFPIEQSCEKEDCVMRPPKAHDLINFNPLGIIKQWAGSKRTNLTKKINLKEEIQHSDKGVKRDMRARSHQSSICDPFMKRSSLLNSQTSFVENLCPAESSKRKKNLSSESLDEYIKQSSLSKRVGSSSLESQATHADSSVMNPKPSPRHAFSPGSKIFSSLGNNALSVSKTSVLGSKGNMKRKWPDFKKPPVCCTSGSDEEPVASRSAFERQHDLTDQISENEDQIERTSDKMYVDRTSALKFRNKKMEFMISRKEEAMSLKNSQPSPRSNYHSVGKNNRFSVMVGGIIQPVTSDAMESSGKEVEIQEDISSEPTSELANGRVSMVFGKRVDPTFCEFAGPDVQLVLQYCNDAYKEHCSAEPVLSNEQMFFADEVGKVMIASNDHMVAKLDTNERQGKYFISVDPISIPGPPGSFLPSPGRMGSEDLQGNSSLTSCRFQSSEDDHELVDMDPSYSPISATSTISNSIAARPDSISLEILSAVSHARHEIRAGFSEASTDPIVESSKPFKQTTNAGEGKNNLYESKVDTMFPEIGPYRFQNNQPCCCSRKEGASPDVALNFQDSVLRQWTLASLPLAGHEKQISADPRRKLDSSTFKSEMIPMREPSPKAEKHVANSSTGYMPMKVSIDTEGKFSSHGDCESGSPTTSNPVLRLMGKNLLVVNKDEDVTAQSSIMHVRAQQQCFARKGASFGKACQDCSSHHMVSKGPVFFGHAQNNTDTQNYGVKSSNDFKIHGLYPPPAPIPNKSFAGSFRSFLECQYIGGCNLSTEQLGSKNRLGVLMTHDTDEVQIPSGSTVREIFVIDDSPGSEADADIKTAHGKENMKGWGSAAGTSASMNLGYNSWHVEPFYTCQSRGYSICSELPTLHSANFQMPHPKGMNSNPVT